MKLPVRVTFRNVPQSPAVEADIRARVAELHTYCKRITGCVRELDIPHGVVTSVTHPNASALTGG